MPRPVSKRFARLSFRGGSAASEESKTNKKKRKEKKEKDKENRSKSIDSNGSSSTKKEHSWRTLRTKGHHLSQPAESATVHRKVISQHRKGARDCSGDGNSKHSRSPSSKRKSKDVDDKDDIGGSKVVKGSKVWVRSDGERVWEKGVVLSTPVTQTSRTFVETEANRVVNTSEIFRRNKTVEEDMTSLWHINEPCILHNLEDRSLNDQAYTFMGPVLVAVNPLMRLESNTQDEKKNKNKSGNAAVSMSTPHPHAVAEVAYQQMQFAVSRRKTTDDGKNSMKEEEEMSGEKKKKKKKKEPVQDESMRIHQSVLISGESGAGKTECSKMVLRHLVQRCSTKNTKKEKGEESLDRRLLGTNPILEALGNASTHRNHNSSRFGRFFRLHFDPTLKGGNKQIIESASVDTYLLERSRVTSHQEGERTFHILYQLIQGTSKPQRKALGLDAYQKPDQFRILLPTPSNNTNASTRSGKAMKPLSPKANKVTAAVNKQDGPNFERTCQALKDVGVSDSKLESLLNVVAGLLHLGDAVYHDETRSQGDIASLVHSDPLVWAAKLFGVNKDKLDGLFSKRQVVVRGDSLVTFRSAQEANFARDALAKAIYARTFDWVVQQINAALGSSDKGNKNRGSCPSIGVLDVFGTESMFRNDLEQLLINYCNEALQSTFNEQVFKAEAELYRREGLFLNNEQVIQTPPDNDECLRLLCGPKGILGMLVSEGQNPNGTDKRFNNTLHESFQGPNKKSHNKCFGKVHPKDKDHCFVVVHFAGAVSYSVGNFLEKNNDALPKEVDGLMQTTKDKILKDIWGSTDVTATKSKPDSLTTATTPGRIAVKKPLTIVERFEKQIDDLISTLGDTRCLFIRCVKPNPQMERVKGDDTWFNRRYVSTQLTCLSIPQTAEVLKTGLPTRIAYATLTESYLSIMPKTAIRAWKNLGRKSDSTFVAALFWAFEIPRGHYKLGLTKVFFRSGMLGVLDRVLSAATRWQGGKDSKEKARIAERFQHYFAWKRWRVCYARVVAANHFVRKCNVARTRVHSVHVIQRSYRNFRKRVENAEKEKIAAAAEKAARKKQGRAAAEEKVKKARKKAEAIKKKRDQLREEKKQQENQVVKMRREERAALKEAKEAKEEAAKAREKKKKKKEKERAKADGKREDNNKNKSTRNNKNNQLSAWEKEEEEVEVDDVDRSEVTEDDIRKAIKAKNKRLAKIHGKGGGEVDFDMDEMKDFLDEFEADAEEKQERADREAARVAEEEAKLHSMGEQLSRAERDADAGDRETAVLVRKATMLQMEENIDAAFESFGDMEDEDEANKRKKNKKRQSFRRSLKRVGQQKKFGEGKGKGKGKEKRPWPSDSERIKIESRLAHRRSLVQRDTRSAMQTLSQVAKALPGAGAAAAAHAAQGMPSHGKNTLRTTAFKLAIKSQRNWRQRYCVLDMSQRTITYFVAPPRPARPSIYSSSASSFADGSITHGAKAFKGLSKQFNKSPGRLKKKMQESSGSIGSNAAQTGRGKIKGVFTIDSPDTIPPPKVSNLPDPTKKGNRPHVLAIAGGRAKGSSARRTLYVSFDTVKEREKWARAIKRTIYGEWQMFLKESNGNSSGRGGGGLGLSAGVDANNAQRMTEEDEEKLSKLISEKSDNRTTLDEAMAQLRQLNDLLESNEITTKSYETLLGTLINGTESRSRSQNVSASFGVQLRCPSRRCGVVNNTESGDSCVRCGAALMGNCRECEREMPAKVLIVENGVEFCSHQCSRVYGLGAV